RYFFGRNERGKTALEAVARHREAINRLPALFRAIRRADSRHDAVDSKQLLDICQHRTVDAVDTVATFAPTIAPIRIEVTRDERALNRRWRVENRFGHADTVCLCFEQSVGDQPFDNQTRVKRDVLASTIAIFNRRFNVEDVANALDKAFTDLRVFVVCRHLDGFWRLPVHFLVDVDVAVAMHVADEVCQFFGQKFRQAHVFVQRRAHDRTLIIDRLEFNVARLDTTAEQQQNFVAVLQILQRHGGDFAVHQHGDFVFFGDAYFVAAFGRDLIKRLHAVAETRGDTPQALVGVREKGFARVHAVSQLLSRNQTDIGHDAFVRTEASALLNQPGHEAVERTPRYRTAGTTIHTLHVAMTRTQAGDVDANAAAA